MLVVSLFPATVYKTSAGYVCSSFERTTVNASNSFSGWGHDREVISSLYPVYVGRTLYRPYPFLVGHVLYVAQYPVYVNTLTMFYPVYVNTLTIVSPSALAHILWWG
jgi:hypothetical protein